MGKWHKKSWQKVKIIEQIPQYSDHDALKVVQETLEQKKGLTTVKCIENLKLDIIAASKGQAFLITGGNCAEELDFNKTNITKTLNCINKIGKIISHAKPKLKIVQLGRMCGQFAKPRSSSTETINGVTLPSFKGEIINKSGFTKEEREPKPQLMLEAYDVCVQTKKVIDKYHSKFYIAHEALLLQYEEALVRKCNGGYYLASTDLPWVGARTVNPSGAHAEFLSGIINPVGIKIWDEFSTKDFVKLVKTINPKNVAGKIVLIIRAGAHKVNDTMLKFIKAVKDNKLQVVWTIDPMHANVKKIDGGIKTRFYEDILKETIDFINVCYKNQIVPAGIHLELTGLSVTECIGLNVNKNNINSKYTTLCDPRLNGLQAVALAKEIAKVI